MKPKFVFFLVLFLFILSCTFGLGSSSTLHDRYNSLARSTLIIKIEAGVCAGFFISNDEVITAAHCINPLRQVHVYEGISYDQYLRDDELNVSTFYELVEIDRMRDLALLRAIYQDAVSPSIEIVRFRIGSVPQVGNTTISIGHPGGQYFNMTTGFISRIANTTPEGVTYLFSSNNIYFGNSGGPLFDGEGYLLGMANSIRVQQSFLGRYISYTEIQEFLEEINYGAEE